MTKKNQYYLLCVISLIAVVVFIGVTAGAAAAPVAGGAAAAAASSGAVAAGATGVGVFAMLAGYLGYKGYKEPPPLPQGQDTDTRADAYENPRYEPAYSDNESSANTIKNESHYANPAASSGDTESDYVALETMNNNSGPEALYAVIENNNASQAPGQQKVGDGKVNMSNQLTEAGIFMKKAISENKGISGGYAAIAQAKTDAEMAKRSMVQRKPGRLRANQRNMGPK